MWQAVGAVATQVLTGGLSVTQMIQAKREQKKADIIAATALADANKILDKNVYAAIGLPMKQFEIERQNLAAAGAQQIEAGRESQRGAAATAGLTMAQYGNSLRGIQAEAEKQYYDLEMAKAEEQARRDDIRAQLKLSEAEGAQLASAMYEERAGSAGQQALMSAAGAIGQGISMVPLFKATPQQRMINDLQASYSKAAKSGSLNQSFLNTEGKPIGFEMATLKNMGLNDTDIKGLDIYDSKGLVDQNKFLNYLGKQDVNDLRDIYRTGYQPFGLGLVE